ncbi:MAG: hypothetical protein JWR53_942 [Glaciihabitans sp.]|nr:hypothetical protein [Glaciihabitans sp.]
MTTSVAQPSVEEFAAAVRAALSDLPADEVEDLTDGLEADLTERADDPDAPDLGDPAAYAEELRSAAGLAPRSASRANIFAESATSLRTEWTAGVKRIRSSRRGSALLDFIVTLRPVWWVLRGWAAWMLGYGMLGQIAVTPNPFEIALLIGLCVVSVQVGRRKWLTWRWMRPIVIGGNILLIVLVPYIFGWAINSIYNSAYASIDQSYSDQSSSGLTYGGKQVGNIFAFDAQGNPLTGVQLYDQDGRPLNAVSDPSNTGYLSYTDANGNETVVVPSSAVPGRPGWNVYPLASVPPGTITDTGTIPPTATIIPGVPPFATVQPLAGPQPTTPADAPTDAPTALPTPSPVPTH